MNADIPKDDHLPTATACENERYEAKRFELQARVVAGSLVLVGVGLGLLVHPYWFGLSAFIGVGLIIAGTTDTCMMGTLLSKIPGNRCAAAGRQRKT